MPDAGNGGGRPGALGRNAVGTSLVIDAPPKRGETWDQGTYARPPLRRGLARTTRPQPTLPTLARDRAGKSAERAPGVQGQSERRRRPIEHYPSCTATKRCAHASAL